MSLKTKEVVPAYIALSSLIQGDRENKYILSSAVRIRLAGNLRRAKGPAEDYSQVRTDLIKRLGTKKDDDAYEVKLTSTNRKEFDEEMKKANDQETEIEAFSKVTMEELFGKEVVDPKTKEVKPQNQIDLEVLSELIASGIVEEQNE